jgi:hypothetical protein
MKDRSTFRVLRFAVTGALLGGGPACTSKKEDQTPPTKAQALDRDSNDAPGEDGSVPPPTLNEGPEPDPGQDDGAQPLPTANPGPEEADDAKADETGESEEGPADSTPSVDPERPPPPLRTNVGRVPS